MTLLAAVPCREPAHSQKFPRTSLPTHLLPAYPPTRQTATPAALQGPAITSEERAEERSAYKRTFYKALQRRMNRSLAGD